MKKSILVLAALGVQSVWAIQNWVSKTDPALNDISIAANWPAGFATDKAVQFGHLNASAPELWMGQDLTLDRMVIAGSNVVLNLGADRILSLGALGELKLNAANASFRLTSGTINQTANQLNIGQNIGASNCVVIVDGASARYLSQGRLILFGSVSNTPSCGLGVYNGAMVDGSFYVGSHTFSSGNWLEASGSGTLLIATNNHFYVGNAAGSSRNRFKISDSARVQFNGKNTFFVGSNAGSDSNRADILSGSIVTGQLDTVVGNYGAGNVLNVQDSDFKMPSLFTVGFYAGGNSARFTNSTFQSGGIYLSRDNIRTPGTNTFEFYGGVLTNTTGGIRIGMYGNGSIGIISNASVTAGGNISAGEVGSDNVLKIYSATTRVTGINIGSGTSTANRNYMLLSGCVITNMSGIGNAGGENVFEIKDGSRVWSFGGIGGNVGGPSNVLRLAGGSVLSATGAFNFGGVSAFNTMVVDNSSFVASNVTFCIGYASGTANSNTVSVINGGYLYATRLRVGDMGGYNNLIISNGTVYAGSDNCTIPYNSSGISTNNRVVFAGTNGVLKSEVGISVRCGTMLEFVIPKGGYIQPPMQTVVTAGQNINIDPTTLIKLDLTEFAKGGGGKQILARTINMFSMSQTTLNSLNAQIAAQNASLAIVGKDLVLTTPHTGGTMLKLY